MNNISLQLYSVRDEVEKDFKQTLKKVAEMGYSGVEFAGYGGLQAEELRSELDQLGLKVSGSHIAIEQFTNNIDGLISFEKSLGNKHIICPYALFENMEKLNEVAAILEAASKKAAEAGMTVSYHNHNHEFEKLEGEYILDLLLSKAPSVSVELDIYWVTKAGLDPIEYMQKYSSRLKLIHIKDMDESTGDSTEIGNGIIDIAAILEAAKQIGVEWFVVEQEHFKSTSIESAQICADRLHHMLQ